jgi:hypothetical protein
MSMGPVRESVVRLNGGLVFRQRQLEAHVAVQMAFRNVMHDLANAPAAFAIGDVEMLRRQSRHGRA